MCASSVRAHLGMEKLVSCVCQRSRKPALPVADDDDGVYAQCLCVYVVWTANAYLTVSLGGEDAPCISDEASARAHTRAINKKQ